MVMQMLAAGGLAVMSDGVRQADDHNPDGYFEDERVKQLPFVDDTSWVAEGRGKALKVISYLLRYLPGSLAYDVLFVRRDLGEVLASQRAMLDAEGTCPGGPDDAAMADIFERHLVQVDAWIGAQPNVACLDLAHREILDDPRAAAERIATFLGRPLDVDAMAAAVDARLYRVRR